MLRIRIQHEPHNFAETESDLTVEECTNKKGQITLLEVNVFIDFSSKS